MKRCMKEWRRNEMENRWPDAYKVISILENAGFEAYVVGGAVRDFVRGVKANDVDITTNALPLQVKELFEHTIDVGIDHGTVLVVLSEPIEVTTFRSETTYSDHRRPDEVTFVHTLEEDLKRRDFTINSMALTKEDKLIDLFGGKSDLLHKVVKAVGNPKERFSEDALRMLRAIRFSAQLDFTLDSATEAAIKVLHPLIIHISIERVKVELEKIWMSDYPSKGMDLFTSTGLSKHFVGNWEASACWSDFESFGIKANGWAFLILMNKDSSYREILSAYKCSNIEKKHVKEVLVAVDCLKKGRWDSVELFQFSEEVLIAASSYGRVLYKIKHSYTPEKIIEEKRKLAISSKRDVVISGNDLMEWKQEKRGPWIKEALDKITIMILNKEIKNDRAQIKEWFFREYIN